MQPETSLLQFMLSWTPVLLIFVLAVFFKKSALYLAVVGTAYTWSLAAVAFHTPNQVLALSALDGVLTTLPLLLVVLGGILLSTLLMETGSLKRIVSWFAQGVKQRWHQTVLIALGVGNFMEGAGVIAEPVVAPMLYASGLSPAASATLSIVGYAGLMTLELAGVIITVLSLVTGLPLQELALQSAVISVPATMLMALSIPWLLGETRALFRTWLLLLASGLLVGFCALGAVLYAGVSVSGMLGGLALILALVVLGKRGLPLQAGVIKDLSPFLLLLVCLLSVNLIPPLRQWTFHRAVLRLHLLPVHTITLRPLFSAYLYLHLAFLLAALLSGTPSRIWLRTLASGLRRAVKPVVAMGLFGAMGQIIAFSGYDPSFSHLEAQKNIAFTLAQGLVDYSGSAYPLFAPFLGWVGTFLTGYGVASIMLFAKLQIKAAALLSMSPGVLASGLTVGASIGSISSPFKVAIATPMCNAVGREGEILRKTIPLGIAVSFMIGLFLRFWPYYG